MYYYIKGRLTHKGDNYLVVDANGVGYMIFTSLHNIENSGAIGSEITMYTYLSVREDAMDLYGFLTLDEKEMYLKLLSVSGVGPKAALSVLSTLTPSKLTVAIITGDAKAITKAQGVGPKAAQRIILDLKDKVSVEGLEDTEDIEDIEEIEVMPVTDNKAEALSALVVLGYSSNDAQRVLAKLPSDLSTEELIKKALANLM